MAIRGVEFPNEGGWGCTKLERFLPKNQRLLNFEFLINGVLSKSAQNLTFYAKNHPNISFFFSSKNTNLGAYFLLLTFSDKIYF